MKRLESPASLFVTLVEKRGSILDFIDPWIPACARMTEGETGITKRPIFCYWLFLFRGFPWLIFCLAFIPCYTLGLLLLFVASALTLENLSNIFEYFRDSNG